VVDDRLLERLKWRSRRGLLELDLVFERFWKGSGSTLTYTDLQALDRLLALPDNDLLDLVMGRAESADVHLRELLAKLRAA
jgi:succinate dehydrogenase flavin-adding protein (antitoxin of CptAB toxin-antitoxin module)